MRVREREREREGDSEREKERVFIFKRNYGPFSYLVIIIMSNA